MKLTVLEAEELLYAAGNILDACSEKEVLDFYSDDKHRRNAASRAWCKMKRALHGKPQNDKAQARRRQPMTMKSKMILGTATALAVACSAWLAIVKI